MNDTYIIKRMTQKELDFTIELAASEGWNPGLHDSDCFYAADNNGFFLGLLNNEPVACLSAVKYSNSFGFVGLYIVKKSYRGKGYGSRIMHAGLEYLKGCNIGLDGVLAQLNNYKKYGFQLAYHNIRYQGLTGGKAPNNLGLIKLTEIPFKQINLYDSAFFLADRAAFLKLWLTQPDSVALGVIHEDKLVAYGVIRACRVGYKIGPLFADSPIFAEILFLALKANVRAEQPVFLDIMEQNSNAFALVRRHKMQPVFETARMYTQQAPALDTERLYGVTSFELG
ncbi:MULTISPECIES: GNAT family N-acetyltransferase [Nitrosomonas]|uniref:Acetyltransferase (GNAT) family protein n=1 Tax=Nitrosomonas communis TaxID=44574 RepID=A0A0F7KFL4_9PROT|nr:MULTISPECIES: GNAT family N-acetyltransferase [Nitrosomonas]AKH37659.1 GCN5 family acetyltransferase [Nitrosomonas communis]TYP83855.1 acetyltransferase (GNAT) family protein [Nitrosomonas communis]UVS62962.1 GNAT family N-acetyltransferase [Nitrosomonas sp. PLL12]